MTKKLIFICVENEYSNIGLVTYDADKAAKWYVEFPNIRKINVWYKEIEYGQIRSSEITNSEEIHDELMSFYEIIPN